jgi:hypothetical protein
MRNYVHLVAATLTIAILASPPARADFFDGARRIFQTDIPHFFQDDIPCAFGGQPTSHTKTSCKAPNQPAKGSPPKKGGADKARDAPAPATTSAR